MVRLKYQYTYRRLLTVLRFKCFNIVVPYSSEIDSKKSIER